MGKKIAIVECRQKGENPIDAHMRNSIAMKEYLDCDLITKPSDIQKDKKYDIIIVSYASFYFDMKLIDFIKKSDAKLFWITNEYNLSPNGSLYKLFKERGAELLTNHERGKGCFSKSHILNINTFLMKDAQAKNLSKYKLIYYGTYRPDRAQYFIKYLNNDQIILSTSPKNIKRYFSILDKRPKVIKKMDWTQQRETLRLFESSLYIEDITTHTNYNFLANRFYEAIQNRVMPIFDQSCQNTIEKSGYPIDLGIVNSIDEAIETKPNYKYIDNLYRLAKIEKKQEFEKLRAIIYG